jgi:hypothetical protein
MTSHITIVWRSLIRISLVFRVRKGISTGIIDEIALLVGIDRCLVLIFAVKVEIGVGGG